MNKIWRNEMNKISLIAMALVATLSFISAVFAGDKTEMKKKHMKNMTGHHYMMKGKGAMHMLMDADQNGTVSAQEFKDFRGQNFSAADKNKDGNLDAEEFSGLSKITAEQRKKAREMAKQKKVKKHFGKMDADGDGKISRDEYDAKGERGFMRMDKNNDGALNKEDRGERKHKLQ